MNKEKNKIPGITIAFYIIIITEMMFFAGLVSAYIIAASKAMDWPPAEQPRLPLWLSLTNMSILLLSGVFMYSFVRKASKERFNRLLLSATILLGVIFLIIQGFEWTNLVNFGIQNSTGLYASYFYTLIALHGVHVFVAIIMILSLNFYLNRSDKADFKIPLIRSFGLFWYFVVLLWPVLYFLLYLY
ncbi:MAG: cytochrome c oxidase subunit 3 [Saprospiraceae bacterium]|nr:cytochrome c oxidase subunit 3 [Saprospiraceae bacterium]